MMLMEAAAKLDTGVMERLREVCEEKGISVIEVNELPDDYILFVHRLKTVYVERIAPSEAIIEFINSMFTDDL